MKNKTHIFLIVLLIILNLLLWYMSYRQSQQINLVVETLNQWELMEE